MPLPRPHPRTAVVGQPDQRIPPRLIGRRPQIVELIHAVALPPRLPYRLGRVEDAATLPYGSTPRSRRPPAAAQGQNPDQADAASLAELLVVVVLGLASTMVAEGGVPD